ncbi:rhamnogalacturonan acetylesterase [Lysobacter sp. cf310]|uniref:rhamnogalacturonan acetylesterase n=1 Tax=Lysobacter sp. cf310 TaxID=1761790 RepID=UPI0008E16EA9|nr:rhamnogalacturonan acetylesterase [Lysobacter sp. cf310]SFL21670.1 Lysophospholipase L1 [Lysobacter sp. cf310]
MRMRLGLLLGLCGWALALPMSAPAAPAPVPAIHLAGDSTLAEKLPEKRPETGWGEQLAARFQPGSVRVLNHAKNGRSTRTFIEEGRWQALLDGLQAGDWVLIQFGHNDQSVEKPDRYTPLADYERNLARFVADVRARGATPILLTPVARRRYDGEGRVQDSHGEYPGRVRALAAREHVALIDLERRSQAVLQEAGVEGSRRLFLQLAPGAHPNYPQGVEDNTHFSPLGARRIAFEFAAALRASDLTLASRLRKDDATP